MGRAGYSLFEVLVAFVVMALVLGTLLPGQAALLLRASDAEAEILALEYAMSRLAVLGVEAPLVQGVEEASYRDWRILTEAISEALEGSETSVIRLQLTVFNRGGQSLATIESVRPLP